MTAEEKANAYMELRAGLPDNNAPHRVCGQCRYHDGFARCLERKLRAWKHSNAERCVVFDAFK